jgi:peptidoglycan/LPS O-acetylase OafA/YrhL
MSEKISYLDGLRGVAAVNVMIMHFFVALAPAMVYGNELPSHFGNLDHIFSTTPLGLIGAGNFSVCIFFVLSGYVLTQKFFKTRDNNVIISSAMRRYIRLFIPVFAAVMLSYLLASSGLYRYYIDTMTVSAGSNYRGYWTFTPDFLDAIKQAAWNSFFIGGAIPYNPVLWTMRVEFFGSMLVFAMALLFGSMRNRWTFYLSLAFLFINFYYLAFVIGIVLADVFNSKTPMFKTDNRIILSIILISGLFLGSYPVSPLPDDSLYRFLDIGFFETPMVIYHIIGAGMLMYVLLNSRGLQSFFSSPVPLFLGKISYSLYLVHFMVISSFTCALFLSLYPVLSYGSAVLVSLFLSLLLIIPLSYLFYKYVDRAGIELSKKFYSLPAHSGTSGNAGYINKGYLSSAIFAIYNKLFK